MRLRRRYGVDATGALDALRERGASYDLLIADLNMPGMDGLALIRAGQTDQRRAADHHHHRVLHRVERHRSRQSRRRRLSDQAVPRPAGARSRRPGAGRTSRVIQLTELTKSFGDRTLLDRVTWQIGDGDRVGLCGPNGAGKTTLLKMLAGLDEPDSGVVAKPADLTIGYLPQDGLTHQGRTVFEEASSAFQPLLDIKAEMHDIEHRLADASVPQDGARCDALAIRRAAGPLPARRRLQHGSAHRHRAARARLRARGLRASVRNVLRRLADADRAGQAAARPAEPAAARRADEPSRSRRAQLARGISRRVSRTPSSSSRTIATSSTRSSRASPTSTCASSPTTSATTASTSSSATRCSSGCGRPSASRTRKSRASRCSSIASATRRRRRRRCRAASSCSRRWCRSRCRPSASGSTSRFPPARRAAAPCSS